MIAISKIIPPALIALRISLGPIIIFGALHDWRGALLVLLLASGVVSDIFDGIIARRLGTATTALRQADSGADVIFWICVLIAAEIRNPGFLASHEISIGAFLLSEFICQALSFAKFRRPLATHTYFAKLWGLMLFAGFVFLLLQFNAARYATLMLVTGVCVNVEVFAIVALAKKRPVDTASIFTLLHRQ